MYDVILVGSGASGGWASKELCERGLKVLMLEAGRTIDVRGDFLLEPGRRGLLPSRLDRALRGQHIQARSANFAASTSHFYVNDRLNPYTYPRRRPFYWIRGRQLGGRLHTWCRAALRMSDVELRPSEHGRGGPDWPPRSSRCTRGSTACPSSGRPRATDRTRGPAVRRWVKTCQAPRESAPGP